MGLEPLWKRFKNDWFYTSTATILFTPTATILTAGLALGKFLPPKIFTSNSFAAQVAYSVGGVLCGLSWLITIVGMFRYWTACDQSRPIIRKIWFAVMIVGLLWLGLGHVLYCFAVYLPQTLKNRLKVQQARS